MSQQRATFAALALAAIFASLLVTSHSAAISNGAWRTPRAVTYLGTVDGKSFFAEMTPKRNWADARKFCSDANMRLATITSAAQANLLSASRNDVNFIGIFWTAGRDSQTLSQFAWDINGQTSPVATNLIGLNKVADIQTCLAYNTDDIKDAHEFTSASCASAQFGTLCEISQ